MPHIEPGLDAAIEGLSPHQRVAVVLRAGHGHTVEEIAALTGTSASTVATHYRRGMAKLRSALGAPRTSTRYGNLSDRELEVFELIGRGMKPAAIATALSISTKTVERHQAAIKEKLGVSQMSELRRIAAIWSNENREAGID